MDVLTIVIIIVLGVLALGLIAYPLWRQTRPEAIFSVNRAGQILEEYEARYQATLVAITDLMFDLEMGKVSSEDYETLLAQAKLEAAEIRQQIDRLSQTATADSLDANLDAEIEQLIAHIRQTPEADQQSFRRQIAAEIELLKQVRAGSNHRSGVPCPACGHRVAPGDAFCAACGHSLAEIKPASAARSPACPQCGRLIQVDDAFCAGCGAALSSPEPSPSLTDVNSS